MSPELVSLIDHPVSLVLVLFVGGLFGILIEQFVAKQKRAEWRRKNVWRWDKKTRQGPWGVRPEPAQKARDAADQLRMVMKADFKPQSLLNKSEVRLFKALDKMVIEMRPSWQVMAQVSLGEILSCEDKNAYACINSKRVDLLIVDDDCKPCHAIEYQGVGHFKDAHATAARDAVKKEALRRAGIGYTEVVPGDTPAELRRLVEKLLKSEVTEIERSRGGYHP